MQPMKRRKKVKEEERHLEDWSKTLLYRFCYTVKIDMFNEAANTGSENAKLNYKTGKCVS